VLTKAGVTNASAPSRRSKLGYNTVDANPYHSLGDNMNANEMADLMILFDSGRIYEHSEEIATMLRQQQAEYYSLLVNHDKLYAKVVEQQAEIEALKAKTLTDEEIIEIWSGMETDTGEQNIDFARAILKKAQNK